MPVIKGVRWSGFAGLVRATPRPRPGAADGPLSRNLMADIGVGVGVGITTALVIALLPTIARRGGVDALGLALLAAAPYVANVLSVLTGRVGPHTPRGLTVLRWLGGLLLVGLVADAGTLPMALIVVGFWMSISFGVPFQSRLWGQMYPAAQRGRLVGIAGTGRAAAAGAGVLVGGLLADQLGGLQVVALGGILGLAFASFALLIRTSEALPTCSYSVRGSLRSLSSRPVLRRATLAQGFLGGGIIAAGPLLAFVQVDRLALSLTDVGMLGILAAAATTLSYVAFGLLIDRRGGVVTMRVGSFLGVLGLLIYALAPSLSVLWVAAVSLGLSSAAIEMGIQGVVAEQTPLDERSAAMAGWSALTGLRGLLAPFVATGLLTLGIVDVTGGLLLAAATSAAGLVIFLRMGTGLSRTGDQREPADGRAQRVALFPRHAARALVRRLAHA